MERTNLFLAIASLVVISMSGLLGVWLGHWLATSREQQKLSKDRRYRIFSLLLELRDAYFWYASSRMHGHRERQAKWEDNIRMLKLKINDELRFHDNERDIQLVADAVLKRRPGTDVEHISREIDDVLDYLSERMNPNYVRVMRSVRKHNVQFIQEHGMEEFTP